MNLEHPDGTGPSESGVDGLFRAGAITERPSASLIWQLHVLPWLWRQHYSTDAAKRQARCRPAQFWSLCHSYYSYTSFPSEATLLRRCYWTTRYNARHDDGFDKCRASLRCIWPDWQGQRLCHVADRARRARADQTAGGFCAGGRGPRLTGMDCHGSGECLENGQYPTGAWAGTAPVDGLFVFVIPMNTGKNKSGI
ncbi:hypothetical protein H2248_000556 [Termitomyces sp. 'cryptogamus']|nr:hypothetical protein H2248_000556 [Termitomyces sp. 'cryptogamus']